jgi:hypothetical protein
VSLALQLLLLLLMMTTIGSLVSLLLVQESTGKLVELIALQQGQEMRQGTVETSEFVAGGIVRQAGLVNDRSAVEVRLNLDEELKEKKIRHFSLSLSLFLGLTLMSAGSREGGFLS